MATRTADWSTVADLIRKVEHRWQLGVWLKPYARGEAFEPFVVSVRAPTARDLTERTAQVQAWVARFRVDAARLPGVEVVDKTLRNRSIGANEVPAKVRFTTFDHLVSVLGVGADTESFDRVLSMTEESVPEATDWVRLHPLKVVAATSTWPRVLSAVRWVIDHDVSQLDLRHIDAPGVDSKFLVEHRRLVRPLLDTVLPASRVNHQFSGLDRRYGFRARPSFIRFRALGNDLGVGSPFSELEVRVDELAGTPLPVTTVYVVENRATFNGFPNRPDSIVIFGGGYAVSSLGPLSWLNDRQLIYWGDIDTHGFRILSRLRELFPHCQSVLMDTRTLEANLDRVVTEPSPLSEELDHLTSAEARVYRDLREDRYAPAVRLEQERIPFHALEA